MSSSSHPPEVDTDSLLTDPIAECSGPLGLIGLQQTMSSILAAEYSAERVLRPSLISERTEAMHSLSGSDVEVTLERKMR